MGKVYREELRLLDRYARTVTHEATTAPQPA
jgi:hypothetical protein